MRNFNKIQLKFFKIFLIASVLYSTLAYIMNKKFVSFIPIKYKKRTGQSKVNLKLISKLH